MKTKLLLLAGGCALALASPASAAPGQCFTASGEPIGPVFETEQPNTAFNTWVQSRGGECRGLRADEVTLYRGQPREYPLEFRRAERIRERPLDVSPGAPRSVPPPLPTPPREATMWEGDTMVVRRLIVTRYQTTAPNVTVVDTGRVVALQQGGSWRIYETVYADGTRRQVAVQIRPNQQYVLMESTDGTRWGEMVELEQ